MDSTNTFSSQSPTNNPLMASNPPPPDPVAPHATDPPEQRRCIEALIKYRRGGLHPLHVGDYLGTHCEYLIIAKLGSGGFATVWLCQDLGAISEGKYKYVAVKVTIASFWMNGKGQVKTTSENWTLHPEVTITQYLREKVAGEKRARGPNGLEYRGKYLGLPTDQFLTEGPNGFHVCLVNQLYGPSLSQFAEENDATNGAGYGIGHESTRSARQYARQLTQAVAFLHSGAVKVVHGDITDSNVLFDIKDDINSLSPARLIDLLGGPSTRIALSDYCTRDGVIYDPSTNSSLPREIYEPVDLTRLQPYFTRELRLIDFGASYFIHNQPRPAVIPPEFCSPELFLSNPSRRTGKEREGRMSDDIWALGCVLYMMRVGEKLFIRPIPSWLEKRKCTMSEDIMEQHREMFDTRHREEEEKKKGREKPRDQLIWFRIRGAFPESQRAEAKSFFDLLAQSLENDVEKRLTAKEMLDHRYLLVYSEEWERQCPMQ